MKQNVRKLMSGALLMALATPAGALAEDQALQLKVEELTNKVERLENKSLSKWLSVGGDYRFRLDSLNASAVSHSNAIGTMNNMVGGFLLDPTVASNTTVSPTQFMLMGQPGKLFSPAQFDTILNTYMPQAMYNAFTAPSTTPNTFLNNLFGIVAGGPPAVPGALGATTLTAQQTGILNTLISKGVLDKVYAMPASASFQMEVPGSPGTFMQVPGANLEEQFNNVVAGLQLQGFSPAQIDQLAKQMLIQGFLGAGSPNLAMVPAHKPNNDTLYTNRFGLDLHAKATKDVTVNVRLLAYKTFGSQTDSAVTNNGSTPFFADRVGVFDGTLGHVPSSSLLNVDRAYATWSNIADQPIWFSVGRRPATDGAPTNLRTNNERPGNGGTPALLVDYAFDGMTIGWAPDIEGLDGAYAKICYGRGFEAGLERLDYNLKDTDMLGIAVIPVDTDPLRVWLQWNRGFNIFDFPVMQNTAFGNTAPSTELGDIDWYGAGAMSTIKNVGPGKLNLFGDAGLSITHPNDNVSNNAGFQGLLTGEFFSQDFAPKDKTGWAAYLGARYDYTPTNTKLGFEFNHGSKNWITFAPAADDMWTSKVGTRGNVYEAYLIQDLNLKPISSHLSKAFIRIGFQYYDFEYTGSNNWVGAPVKIADIQSTDMMLLTPLKSARDIYASFEVKF